MSQRKEIWFQQWNIAQTNVHFAILDKTHYYFEGIEKLKTNCMEFKETSLRYKTFFFEKPVILPRRLIYHKTTQNYYRRGVVFEFATVQTGKNRFVI